MSRISSVPRVNPQSFTPADQHGVHVDQQMMSHNTNNPAATKTVARNRSKLNRRQLKLLAKLGDLTSEKRVPNCAKVLADHGYEDYKGLWKDISAAMPEARRIKAKLEEVEFKKLKAFQTRIAKKLNKTSWNAVKKMGLESLTFCLSSLKIPSQKQLVQELIIQKQAKLAKQAERAKSKQVVQAAEVREIFFGSDGERSKALYSQLERIGPHGRIAALCLRAQKASDKANFYIFREYKRIAYERQNEALIALVDTLNQSSIIRTWGWGRDEAGYHKWVLYVDLPQGQVSWHNESKIGDRDYPNQSDGTGLSQERILAFAATQIDPLFETAPIAPAPPHTS